MITIQKINVKVNNYGITKRNTNRRSSPYNSDMR